MGKEEVEEEQGRVRIGRSVTWGNFISPAITVILLGVPGLIWGGKIDSNVSQLKSDIVDVRREVSEVKTTSQTTSATLVGISYTISEGLKQTMADLSRRMVSAESRLDSLTEENKRLQIELATIRRASEPPRSR